MSRLIKAIPLTLLSIFIFAGCNPEERIPKPDGNDFDKVLLYMGFGNNDLGGDIRANVATIESNPLPLERSNKAIIVFEHIRNDTGTPALIRLTSGWDGIVVRDTLKTWPYGTLSTSTEMISEVTGFVLENFKTEHYGLILSSHGTGWMPKGYYTNPEVRPSSFGSENYNGKVHELTITELAGSLAMHFDYILLDACLMGGIETAYELRNSTDCLLASSAEIIDEGMDYSVLTSCLLKDGDYDFNGFCRAFVDFYMDRDDDPDTWQFSESAAISVTDCRRLEGLASLCRNLFEKYRTAIRSLDDSKVQKFFRTSKHWFYDLEDILVNAGIDDEEKAALRDALDECVPFKMSTPVLFSNIEVSSFCGLTMYLPSMGNGYLDGYYSTLAWNDATGLVN